MMLGIELYEFSQQIIHHAPYGFMMLTYKGVLVYQNRYMELLFERVLGRTPPLGVELPDAFPTAELQRIFLGELLAAQHEASESVLRVGSVKLKLNGAPLPDGQHIAFWVQDISEEDVQNQRRAQVEAALHGVLNACPDPMLICRDSGEIRYANPAAAKRLKRPVSRLLGSNLNKLLRQVIANQVDKSLLKEYNRQLEALVNPAAFVGKSRSTQWQLGAITEELLCYRLPELQGYVLFIRDISAQKLAAQSETYALALSLQTEQQTLEAERSRMARDLHDGFAQWTAAAQLHAEALRLTYQPIAGVLPHHEALMEALKHLGDELHRLTLNTQPAALEEKGLLASIQILFRNFERANPLMAFEALLPNQLPHLEPLTQTVIYRVVQENLRNTSRHAEATEVRVQLSVLRRHVLLLIEDNGKGFDLEQQQNQPACKSGGGLRNMQQRARAIGAELEVESRPGHGTSLLMRIPYA